MDDENVSSSMFNNGDREEIRERMMMISLSALFLSLIMVLLFHLHAKLLWWRMERHRHQYALHSTATRRHGTLVFAIGPDTVHAAGLDPSVLRSIPVVTFKQQDFKNGLECVVCLSELIEGEKARVLPNCHHGFHVDCIDMWFHSHSTCPLCRNRVVSSTATSSVSEAETESVTINIGNDQMGTDNHNGDSQNPIVNSGFSTESSNFPANQLVRGNQNQISSTEAGSIEDNPNPGSLINNHQSTAIPNSGNGTHEDTALVINVPENVNVNSSSSSSERFVEEDRKSPPVTSTVR